jgi:hypothetical protein
MECIRWSDWTGSVPFSTTNHESSDQQIPKFPWQTPFQW